MHAIFSLATLSIVKRNGKIGLNAIQLRVFYAYAMKNKKEGNYKA